MDAQDLWNEAMKMARPAVRLSPIPSGAALGGCYGGPPLPGATLAGRHLLSFDGSLLPGELAGLLQGTATLHAGADEDSFSGFEVIAAKIDFAQRAVAKEEVLTYPELARGADDDGRRLVWTELESNSVPLYAYPERSLPQVSDLFRFGSPAIQAWLTALGWTPRAGYNPNFDRRSSAAAEYDRLWWEDRYGDQGTPPALWSLPRGRSFAVLGGWPMKLIDEELPEGRLILTVFAEEEPRRYVFAQEGGGFATLDEVT